MEKLKVKLLVKKDYNDVRVKRFLVKGDVIEAEEKRARYLLSTGYVTILEINKFNRKKNERTNSAKKRKS